MRMLPLLFLAFQALALTTVHAQPPELPPTAKADAQDVTELDTLVVTGAQPGPGMWKVSKGDHTLWILGTLTPLPNEITWLSRDVDAVIDQSQQVLGPPGVKIDAKIGLFKGLTLLPSALKAAKNPDGRRLDEVLPPDLYARWAVLKKRYMGRDAGVEKKRPLLAANELYEKALHRSGIGKKPIVTPVIDAALKRRGLKLTPTVVSITIADPKEALKDIRASEVDDIQCFRSTLARIENDLPRMVERANAWSIGDLEALRALPYEDQQVACFSAVAQTAFARKRGITDLPQRVQAQWIKVAEAALEKNPVTFATLPIGTLIKPDGYLAALRAKGYLVEEP